MCFRCSTQLLPLPLPILLLFWHVFRYFLLLPCKKWAEVYQVKLCTRSPLCLGQKKKFDWIFLWLFSHFPTSSAVCKLDSPTVKNRGRVGCIFSVRRSAAQVLGRLRDAPQHTCWSCEQSWQRLRSDLAAAAQMQCNFGVESSVNIPFCCACSAFIWLLPPRASVFLCSSGGLHSVQPPLTTSKTKPYTFIRPYFHNKSLYGACLCLRLALDPQITANRRRNSKMAAAHFLPRLLLRHYRVYKNSRERQYRCDHHVVCCCFFLLLPTHQSGFWNYVLLWITGEGRERVSAQRWKRIISNRW